MLFNARERRVLDLLILYGESSITDLTDYFNISERTLRRSFSSINDSIIEYKLEIIVKNDFVYLIGSNVNKNELAAILDSSNDYSHAELKVLILYELFYQEALSLLNVSYLLNLSVYSVNNILEELKLENGNDFNYSIEKGKGIKVEISESYKRFLLNKYISLLCNDYLSDFLQGFNSTKIQINNKVIEQCLNLDLTYKVEKLLQIQLKSQSKQSISDNSYLNVVLMFSITLDRISKGYYINNDMKSDEMITNKNSDIIHQILRLVTQHSLNLQSEYYYLSKIYFQLNNKLHSKANYENLTDRLIERIEESYGVKLNSEQLREDIITHFNSFFSNKYSSKSFYEKKLVNQIKNDYLGLFNLLKKEMLDYLGEENTDDEQIVYILLHFGVELIERNINIDRNKEILAVCSSGMGSSKMMTSILNRELSNVNIQSSSVYKLFNEIDIEKFDLIVTTINLGDILVPYVIVSPLITDNQMRTIKERLNKI